MELDLHTTKFMSGFVVGGVDYSAAPAQQDRVATVYAWNVPNGSGAAGATVTVAVTFPQGQLPANSKYFVDYDLPADYTVFTTNKTTAGFTVNLQPRLASNSVAAGTFNCQVNF